jgi:hypothetical protein
LRVIRCPTLQVSQFLFPGQRSDTFLTDHVYVLPDDGVSHRNMWELFNVNFNANLKLFIRISNCASVGEKNFDNYQDSRYVGENYY